MAACWMLGMSLLGQASAQPALAQSVSQKAEPPRLVVQVGQRSMTGLAFSPDGKTVASGDAENALIVLRDVPSGRELRTLDGHRKGVSSVAFSPDGKTMASGGVDATVKLWEVASGRELRKLVGHGKWVHSVAFSPDGKSVLSGSQDKTLKLWDAATGLELRTIAGHTEDVWSVAFSPDGKTVVSGSSDKTAKLWDTATGRELRTLAGHVGGVMSVAYSPDGRTVVSGAGGRDKTVKLWDVATGRELHTLAGHVGGVMSVAYSPDGQTLASGSLDKSLKLWDMTTGRELHTLNGDGKSMSRVAFSPNGQTVAAVGGDALKLWNVATGRELRTLRGYGHARGRVAFSPDGKSVMSGSLATEALTLWDVAMGRELRSFKGLGTSVESIAFSPDGQTVVSGDENAVTLWSVATGRELRKLEGHHDFVAKAAFSPDGKTVVSGSAETVKLWDVASGRELRSFQVNGGLIALSPDGQTVVSSGGEDGKIGLWDLATGRELRTFGTQGHFVLSIDFSPNGQIVVTGGGDNTIKLWDIATGRELRTLGEHGSGIMSVAFSPDGRTVVSADHEDKTVKLWEVATGRVLHTLAGHRGGVLGVAFSPDGKILASGSIDGTLKLWRVTDGALLATLASFTDGHWAVTDPEGRFDASNGGDNPHLHWVFENTPIDLAQLKDRYYDPGLLQKIMGYGTEPLRTVPKFEDALLHRWPEVAVSADAQDPLRINIRLSDRGDGYGRVRVRLNGKEIAADAAAGKGLSGKTAQLTLDLDPERLLPGDNRLDVLAWPAVGHIPSPSTQIAVSGAMARGASVISSGKKPAAEPVTLHAVVMGVSQYAGANLRLAFSGKDANDFAQTLELGGLRMFGAARVRVHRLSDYAGAGANVAAERLPSRDNLRHAFETIAKEAKAGDILLVYLAGHGVMTPGVAGEAEYYYLSREAQSTDLTDPAVRKLWGISSTELTDWIKQIKASKQVLVLDTCAAGGAIDKLVAKRQIPGAQVIALEQLKDRTGVHILAGAAADRVSYEATQFGQGLLTYALLTGMKGAALKDEIVDVQRLFQYTRDEVPKLARQIGGIQEPRLSSPQGESFAIGRMDENDRRNVPLSKIKPMIQRASFQDEARGKDVLKLSQHLNDRLKLETYAVATGAMVYVDAEDFPDAWQVTGRYTKTESGVQVKMWLFQGDAERAAFEVLLPLDEAAQTNALLAATMTAMKNVGSGK